MKKLLVDAVQTMSKKRKNNIDLISKFVDGLIAQLIKNKAHSLNLRSSDSLTSIFFFIIPATRKVAGKTLIQMTFVPDWYKKLPLKPLKKRPDFFDHNNLGNKLTKVPNDTIGRILKVITNKEFVIECG
jgi:hypothetical protein